VEWLEKTVIGGVAVFLGLVMDVDLPLFAASEE
jgi:hypothetical protein